MALNVLSSVLEVTKVLLLQLQAVSNDILECHAQINATDHVLKTMRSDENEYKRGVPTIQSRKFEVDNLK